MKSLILSAGATLALLATVGSVQAQRIGGSGGSGSSGGGFGSSGGGFGSSGSSSFGSSGSSSFGSSGGGFTGGSGGSSGGGFTGGSGAAGGRGMGGASGGSGSFSSNSPFAAYNGNPLMGGFVTGTSSGSGGATNNRYAPLYASPVSFGTAMYNNTASVGTSGNQGVTSALGGGRSGQGSTGTAALYRGATSAGFRRAPSIVTETIFDRATPRSAEVIRAHVISTVANASRLPSRNRIQVTMDGGAVYLRGRVRDNRERRLAEAIVRMTPGIRDVRNELVPDKLPTPRP